MKSRQAVIEPATFTARELSLMQSIFEWTRRNVDGAMHNLMWISWGMAMSFGGCFVSIALSSMQGFAVSLVFLLILMFAYRRALADYNRAWADWANHQEEIGIHAELSRSLSGKGVRDANKT